MRAQKRIVWVGKGWFLVPSIPTGAFDPLDAVGSSEPALEKSMHRSYKRSGFSSIMPRRPCRNLRGHNASCAYYCRQELTTLFMGPQALSSRYIHPLAFGKIPCLSPCAQAERRVRCQM